MRKVLSFVLVLSLVLGSFGMAFAAPTATPSDTQLSDIDGLACEDAVRVLASLSVVSGYEDGTYKPEQTVTRAEMASLIINALGLKETDAVPKFADSTNHWARGYIAYANTLGVISGRSETVFDPDATVTYDEATTMLIKALGYTDDSLVGTYPASYVSRARVLGILDGVQTGAGGANRGDIAIMLYQTLDQTIGMVDKDGNFQGTIISAANVRPEEYDTMLERLGASLRDSASYSVKDSDHSFILTRDDAEDALINVYPYIGAVVSAYENSDGDIIAIKEVYSTFINGTYDSTDKEITAADGSKYDVINIAQNMQYNRVTSSTTVTTASGLKNSDVNNTIVGSISGGDDTYYTFAVDLSGKNIREIYSVNFWDITDGTMVEADDLEDLEDNELLGYSFPEDDNGDIDEDAFELIGVNALSEIKEDHVVYVYTEDGSKNTDITRVAVGTETPSGAVSRVSSDEKDITINGTKYSYASEELKNNGGDLNDAVLLGQIDVDDEVKLNLDAYGFIFDFDKTAGAADNFAVVLNIGQARTGLNTEFQVELFLADGTTKTFTIDEDDEDLPVVTTPGGLWITDTAINPDKAGLVTAGALIKYGVNSSGEVDSIEFLNDMRTVGSAKAVTSRGYWDGKEILSDAVIFTYDGDGVDFTDDDDYDTTTLANALDSDSVTGTYFINSRNQIEGALLVGFSTGGDIYAAVTEWSRGSGDLFNLTMYVDGSETEEYQADMSRIPARIDTTAKVYRLKFNGSGRVTGFDDLASGTWTDAGYYELAFTSDNAIDVSGTRVTVRTAAVTPSGIVTNGAVEADIVSDLVFNLDSSAVIYMLDENDDWSTERRGELGNVDANDVVRFYNTDDDDLGITTIVVIKKNR